MDGVQLTGQLAVLVVGIRTLAEGIQGVSNIPERYVKALVFALSYLAVTHLDVSVSNFTGLHSVFPGQSSLIDTLTLGILTMMGHDKLDQLAGKG